MHASLPPTDTIDGTTCCIGRRACSLRRAHPLPGDEHITFEPKGHLYTAYGAPVDRSVTRLIDDCFERFDAAAVAAKFYEVWKQNPCSGYHTRIHALLAAGRNDAQVQGHICAGWSHLGENAARLGTAIHAHCEYIMNGETVHWDEEIATEVAQYAAFTVSTFATQRGLEPYRSELCVACRGDPGRRCEARSMVVSAGQIDALYTDQEGMYYLVDFKRVHPKHPFSPDAVGYRGRCGVGIASHLPDTRFHRYCLQTAVYNLMLVDTNGIDVGVRMFLLRLHSELADTYELVQCLDLRAEAAALLAAEQARQRRALDAARDHTLGIATGTTPSPQPEERV